MQQLKGQLTIWELLQVENPNAALSCSSCVFCKHGICQYETNNNYCEDGDKLLTKNDGWHLVDGGRDIPHNKDWELLEVITYYKKTDKYNREEWLGKDSTFKGTCTIKDYRNTPEVIAWRYANTKVREGLEHGGA